ncbi:MAG: glycerophosphodiester phosphodiesterase [Dehalococcoidia bacterium]|nr:glycerophosphodiester phosphodiesterase [Dehalococcoidia bacterium]
MPGGPMRIAHGFGNRRELVRLALDRGIEMIEGDVRLGRGRLWMRHDRRLPLLPVLLGRRPRHLPLTPRWDIALGPWHARVDPDPLPLEELLAMASGRCRLLLDLKPPRRQADVPAFAEALARLLRGPDLSETVWLCGDWALLDEAQRLTPEYALYYSVGDRGRWRDLARRLEAGDPIRRVSVHAGLLDKSTAGFLRDRGVEIICWAVYDLGEAERVTALGVDGIISPDLGVLLGGR